MKCSFNLLHYYTSKYFIILPSYSLSFIACTYVRTATCYVLRVSEQFGNLLVVIFYGKTKRGLPIIGYCSSIRSTV